MAEHPYFKTSELATRYGVKPHTIRLWCGNGKQKREGFPKPRFKSDQLNFLRQDIFDWKTGNNFS